VQLRQSVSGRQLPRGALFAHSPAAVKSPHPSPDQSSRPPAPYAVRNATILKGTASLKLDSDPLGSQFLNDLADAPKR